VLEVFSTLAKSRKTIPNKTACAREA